MPSYFHARESIIPKLQETPIPKSVFKPADISPSTKIKTDEPEPQQIDVTPDKVAPPTFKFYKKLKSAAGIVAADLGSAILENAVNAIFEIKREKDQAKLGKALIAKSSIGQDLVI